MNLLICPLKLQFTAERPNHRLSWWNGLAPWGKTVTFPPKGGLANRSFFTGRPLKSGSLLMLHLIPFVLPLNILLYCFFVDITDRFTIISSCPEVTVSFLSLYPYLDGTIRMIRPANSLKFCVCRITLPGPVSFVRNSPSPPRKIFLSPFTVSIS